MRKYIITDPCYLIPDDDWSKCCEIFDSVAYKKAMENRDYEMQRELFDNGITAAFHNHDFPLLFYMQQNQRFRNIYSNRRQVSNNRGRL